MSEIDLLPKDGADQSGFSAETGEFDAPNELAVSDGISGMRGDGMLSDEAGAPEFGADEAENVPEAATAQADVDDYDLLGDPGELSADDLAALSDGAKAREVAEPDGAEFETSMQRAAADVAATTEQNGGRRHEHAQDTGSPAEPGDAVATTQAHPAPAEHTAGVVGEDGSANDEQQADPADGEAVAAESLGNGKSATAERLIGQLATVGDRQIIIDSGAREEPARYAPDRSVATLERPHVGDRYSETDQLRGRTAGERSRLQQLERLPHTGFTSQEIKQVRAQIAALGYPVDNFRQFNHKHNERGTEDTIASWLGHGHGEFTVYDLYHKQIPEKRLGTLSHETAHANSPLKPENEAVYGQAQSEAAQFVSRVAQQSLLTNVHLNGYHKYLINEYRTNMGKLTDAHGNRQITDEEMAAAQAEVERKFSEETWAIMNEMALTNRAGLADVEARQFKALDRLAGQQDEERASSRVALISDAPTEDEPSPTTWGIDRWLIHLIDGVNNQEELVQHVATLKQRFYGAANNEKAAQRVQRRYAQAA